MICGAVSGRLESRQLLQLLADLRQGLVNRESTIAPTATSASGTSIATGATRATSLKVLHMVGSLTAIRSEPNG